MRDIAVWRLYDIFNNNTKYVKHDKYHQTTFFDWIRYLRWADIQRRTAIATERATREREEDQWLMAAYARLMEDDG